MGASHRQVRQYRTPDLSPAQIELAARDCRFKVASSTPSRIALKASVSVWSFGEQLEVDLAPLSEETIVDVRSRSALPTQVLDWGKNRRNVRRLFAALDRRLGLAVESRPVPRCARCDYLLAGIDAQRCPECGMDLRHGTITEDRPRGVLKVGLLLATVLSIGELVMFGIAWQGWFKGVLGSSPLVFTLMIGFVLFINFSVVLLLVGLHRAVLRFRGEG